jgi:hypothetical protein
MALILRDRVKVTSPSTGTGDFSLGAAESGSQSFSAVMSDGDQTYYTIANDPADEWEVGIGTFNSANTLTRNIVLDSSNSGSLVNFQAGDKFVFITYPAGKSVTKDQAIAYAIALGG